MEKLILGFDLCDDVTKISRYRLDNMNPADISFPQADNRTVIQTALGRKKGQDGWLVGKEAYEAVLEGGGAVVDKLLTLLTKKSSVAVGDRRYQPEQLLGRDNVSCSNGMQRLVAANCSLILSSHSWHPHHIAFTNPGVLFKILPISSIFFAT